MNNPNAVVTLQREESRLAPPLTANDIIAQVTLIQQVMGAVMKDKEHYGTIPGCGDKPTLLQPGAQKLLLTFRLAPEYEVMQTDMDKGHREYRVHCTLRSIGSNGFCGSGVGCCSTMEGKFRFRVAPKKITDRPVPREYWDLRVKDLKAAQALLGGAGFSTKKDDNGEWKITEGSSEKVEHDNPADYYNTVLKMAKKRALVDATLTATAASDIFTQDIEDMPEVLPGAQQAPPPPPQATAGHQEQPKSSTPTKPAPKATQTQQASAGEVVVECMFEDYQEKTGTTNGKPWTMFVCSFDVENAGPLEATTFDKKVGDVLPTLKGNKIQLRYKPGFKPGKFDIVSIQPTDDVPF